MHRIWGTLWVLGTTVLACGSETIGAVQVGGPGAATDAGADAAVPQTSCDATRIERCQVGRCIVSAPRTTLQDGEHVELVELPSASLGADPLPESSLCQVDLPARFAIDGIAVTLTLELAGAAPPDAVLFRALDGEGVRVAASAPSGKGASGLVSSSGTFGVTRMAGALALATTLVGDPQRSDTLPALIRNVSSSGGRGATWDGTSTYVASGARVLVYSGMPGPASRPSYVLGQPSLDVIGPGISAGQLDGVSDVWTDGQKLAIANGNRVLLWRQKPTAGFTPADVVIGQDDFVTSTPNTGGLSASSMNLPWGIDSSGANLLVADLRNDRVLGWDHFPDRNGDPATGLIGGPSFTVPALGGPIYQARGVALDGLGAWVASYFTASFHVADALATSPTADVTPLTGVAAVTPTTLASGAAVALLSQGGLAYADGVASRVAVYRQKPSGPRAFDFALGQVDSDHSASHPLSASSFSRSASGPEYMRSASPYLFVGDGNRTLVFDHAPRYFFEPADRVLRQPGFTTAERGLDTRFVSERALGFPTGVAVSSTALAVADRGNNRVLIFPHSSLASDDPAAVVALGQTDMVSVIPNVDQVSASASTLSGPTSVIFAGARLVVADTENHRVLVWNTVPTTTGAPADLVLGQADAGGHRPNRNRGDTDVDGHSDASLDGLFAPSGLASDGSRLFVADRAQNRVLVWDTFPTQDGQPADRAFGQNTSSGVLANRGQGSFAVLENGLALPAALLLDGDSLYVTDTDNNRVLRWDGLAGEPVLGRVFGQPDGVTVTNRNVLQGPNPGYFITPPTASGTVLSPVGLALAAGRLYVSERGSSRVHVFDAADGSELAVLGHSNPSVGGDNEGGPSAQSLASPAGLATDGTTLWIADTNNHRVVGTPIAATTTSFAAATRRIGQPSWSQNGYSRSLPASAGGAPRPSAVAATTNALYVAETAYNRVLVYDRTDLAAGLLSGVYGQPDATSIGPNQGGAPSASTLSAPRGVFVSDAFVIVADTGNSRVLVFDRQSPAGAAVRVLGQQGFGGGLVNGGGAASLASLAHPEAVSFDGTRLFVADTGNHRVLVWNGMPAADGAPADAVLGQADAAGSLANQGSAAAAADRLASPTGVLADATGLFVADTQNNRVLHFTAPFATGQTADQVLGQATADGRTPAASLDDLDHGSGPVSLASDGHTLFVGERDGRRILAFRPESGHFAAESRIAGTEAPGGFVTPLGLVLERTPLFTSRLIVADAGQNRVVVFESASRLREP